MRLDRRWVAGALAWLSLHVVLFAPALLVGLIGGSEGQSVPAGGLVEAALVRREGWPLARLSVDVALLIAALVLVPPRWRRPVRRAGGAGLAVLLLFTTYDIAYASVFQRPAALWEDVGYVHGLWNLVADQLGALVTGLLAALCALAVVALAWLGAGALGVLEALLEGAPRARRVLLASSALVVAWWALLWWPLGVRGGEAVVQLRSVIPWRNLQESLARRERAGADARASVEPGYRALVEQRLARRPNVYLLMVEAYGARLAMDPSMAAPYVELLRRVAARLAARGLASRSSWSAAPIFGGRSWLSISTVQTGLKIDYGGLYEQVTARAGTLPSWTRFFAANGYRTLALQPGNRLRTGARAEDPFRRDVIIEAPDLAYTGTEFDWGRVPDQYSLGWFEEHVLAREPSPRFVFFMSVSTHYRWPAIPYVGNWRALNTPGYTEPDEWPPIAGVEGIREGLHRDYFQSVIYEWRVLLDFIERHADEHAVFFVLGDHQPLLERTVHERFDEDVAEVVDAQTRNTPFHVITGDGRLLEAFADFGLQPGLVPEPGTQLQHEGLFSLVAEALLRTHGETPPAHRAFYRPGGVTPGVLRGDDAPGAGR